MRVQSGWGSVSAALGIRWSRREFLTAVRRINADAERMEAISPAEGVQDAPLH